MEDYSELRKKLSSSSDSEFLKYVNEYFSNVNESAYKIVIEEIRKRNNLYNEIEIERLIESRNEKRKQKHIEQILSNFHRIDSINEIVEPLKTAGCEELEIINICSFLLEDLKKSSEALSKKNRNALYFLIGGIILSAISYTGIFGPTYVLFYGAVIYGLYTLIFGDKTSELENTIYLLNKYIKDNKLS
jgi:hypothetical protein